MTRTPLSAPDQLKRFREHLGYSQRELADVFGVTHGAIAMWENGTREMPGVALALLERLEIEFHVVTSGKIDPMLDEKHLSAKFAEVEFYAARLTKQSALKSGSRSLVSTAMPAAPF